MLLGGRSISPLTTKPKSTLRQTPSKSPIRQEAYKTDSKPQNYQKAQLKTKETMGILYSLE
jgi:hypothetical protein